MTPVPPRLGQTHINIDPLVAAGKMNEVDAMLERTLLFLDEVRGVPVLLSMLVLLFKHRQEGSTEPLPKDRYELYEMATRLAATSNTVLEMLRLIACANQMAGIQREFTTAQAEEALARQKEGLEC